MSDYKSRALIELNELSQRTDKLRDYVVSEAFEKLPEIERIALKVQLSHMVSYRDILNARVSRMANAA